MLRFCIFAARLPDDIVDKLDVEIGALLRGVVEVLQAKGIHLFHVRDEVPVMDLPVFDGIAAVGATDLENELEEFFLCRFDVKLREDLPCPAGGRIAGDEPLAFVVPLGTVFPDFLRFRRCDASVLGLVDSLEGVGGIAFDEDAAGEDLQEVLLLGLLHVVEMGKEFFLSVGEVRLRLLGVRIGDVDPARPGLVAFPGEDADEVVDLDGCRDEDFLPLLDVDACAGKKPRVVFDDRGIHVLFLLDAYCITRRECPSRCGFLFLAYCPGRWREGCFRSSSCGRR